ncbi:MULTISPECIES: transcriptional regulator [Enterobacteriaceae]|uniref:Helix-turn-helix domain-containing protein n=2 Tax=Enterobacteriaceae TaxID=543 RepID=A0A8H9ULA1_CITFR|nr:helix-turn-helix domain-containing protein [Citrobacter freundii]MBA7876645.1 helix-turn-helix domain-containing protein [Citrobacter sp. RHBSTW-00827]MBA7938313.1 helix-turn-helix domain-containing protein [Citrobacter sp. RHBSTW-00509]QLS94387.1 helix-turn-helix domain-containing protein [Citrobacter sp. RHBSTW-00859]QLT56568.1 helix-turn-helix domain-containing protein [Citrobacter sp. RHBSTW-00821]QLU32850.1 helix-turn-helix domain-containing protein [Citrobacter sp. RHBSTW-00446]QLZ78
MKSAIERAIDAAGGVNALARAIGVKQPSVSRWRKVGVVGVDHVPDVSALTGIPAYELRPDKPKLFPHPSSEV